MRSRTRTTALATLTILLVFFFVPPAQAATTLVKPPNNLGLVGYWSFRFWPKADFELLARNVSY